MQAWDGTWSREHLPVARESLVILSWGRAWSDWILERSQGAGRTIGGAHPR